MDKRDPFDDLKDMEDAMGPERPRYSYDPHEDEEPAADTDPPRSRAKSGADRSPICATPYVYRDPATIPVRQWVYGKHLIRKFLSTTAAPGAVGKSSFKLVESIAMAAGRALLGVAVPKRLRVWYWNGEDPLEEIERRVAAICIHYGIDGRELEGYLFLDSGRTSSIVIASRTKEGAKVAEPLVDKLIEQIREHEIDVLVIDPFVSSHGLAENSNDEIDLVAKTWNRIADAGDAAIELVHHVRKGMGPAGEYTVEDGRGAVALLAAARSARVLNPMTKDEAERAGLESHRGYFRVDNGKSNLAPPPDRSEWFHLTPVSLGNGPPGILDYGDQVAVVEPWEWPDQLADITTADLIAAQTEVRATGPWRENSQAKDWVGIPIGRVLKLDPQEKADKEKIKRALKVWIANGMFESVTGKDAKGNDRPFIEVGTPATE
ncbi:AAA family ATPase [Methylobacterium longum]|uniref:AAA family ATPase n=1 Tax=Methylobacterium longum TaxID=767694 RepID=A0ABT8AQR5_9HYPH|nr:AAA family ATPase [Methylobacterium longum]MDN3572085.1 AAA family ATPase [Methylobacterium longum]